MENNRILIKRYGNRRLYDTSRKSYINLEVIAQLIQEGYEVTIIDNHSREDITQQVLTQVIPEREKTDRNIFPLSVLHLLIRQNDATLREFFHQYMSLSLQAFLTFKAAFDKQMQTFSQMPGFFPSAIGNPSEPQNQADEQSRPEDLRQELIQLRQRLAELEQKIS
jgi:polyhydroxyalkanoate synthesis repressor PhaR